MRCKTCHYSLANLTEHRCPECGNAFDPSDPETLACEEKWFLTWLQMILVVVIAVLLLVWLLPTYFSHP